MNARQFYRLPPLPRGCTGLMTLVGLEPTSVKARDPRSLRIPVSATKSSDPGGTRTHRPFTVLDGISPTFSLRFYLPLGDGFLDRCVYHFHHRIALDQLLPAWHADLLISESEQGLKMPPHGIEPKPLAFQTSVQTDYTRAAFGIYRIVKDQNDQCLESGSNQQPSGLQPDALTN